MFCLPLLVPHVSGIQCVSLLVSTGAHHYYTRWFSYFSFFLFLLSNGVGGGNSVVSVAVRAIAIGSKFALLGFAICMIASLRFGSATCAFVLPEVPLANGSIVVAQITVNHSSHCFMYCDRWVRLRVILWIDQKWMDHSSPS